MSVKQESPEMFGISTAAFKRLSCGRKYFFPPRGSPAQKEEEPEENALVPILQRKETQILSQKAM